MQDVVVIAALLREISFGILLVGLFYTFGMFLIGRLISAVGEHGADHDVDHDVEHDVDHDVDHDYDVDHGEFEHDVDHDYDVDHGEIEHDVDHDYDVDHGEIEHDVDHDYDVDHGEIEHDVDHDYDMDHGEIDHSVEHEYEADHDLDAGYEHEIGHDVEKEIDHGVEHDLDHDVDHEMDHVVEKDWDHHIEKDYDHGVDVSHELEVEKPSGFFESDRGAPLGVTIGTSLLSFGFFGSIVYYEGILVPFLAKLAFHLLGATMIVIGVRTVLGKLFVESGFMIEPRHLVGRQVEAVSTISDAFGEVRTETEMGLRRFHARPFQKGVVFEKGADLFVVSANEKFVYVDPRKEAVKWGHKQSRRRRETEKE